LSSGPASIDLLILTEKPSGYLPKDRYLARDVSEKTGNIPRRLASPPSPVDGVGPLSFEMVA
jgi:hypothetical protein